MDGKFTYLDNDDTRSLINVINYIIEPKLLINDNRLKALATKLSKPEYMNSTISKAMQRINTFSMQQLIEDIKDYDNVIIKFCEALNNIDYNNIDYSNKKDNIRMFLIEFLPVVSSKTKINVFETLFIRDQEIAFNILIKEKDDSLKNLYLDQATQKNAEETFVYLTCMKYEGFNIKKFDDEKFDDEKLIQYIFQIQQKYDEGVIEVIFKLEKISKKLLAHMKIAVNIEDFKVLYIISKNRQFFDKDINNEELKQKINSIEDFVRILKLKYEGEQLENTIIGYLQRWKMNIIIYHLENMNFFDVEYNHIFLEKIFSNVSKFTNLLESTEYQRKIVEFILSKGIEYRIEVVTKAFSILKKIELTNSEICRIAEIYEQGDLENKLLIRVLDLIRQNFDRLDTCEMIKEFISNPVNFGEEIKSIALSFIFIALEHADINTIINFYRTIKQLDEKQAKVILYRTEEYCIISEFKNENFIKLFLLDEFKPLKEEVIKKSSNYKEVNREEYEVFIEKFEIDRLLKEIKIGIDRNIDTKNSLNIISILKKQEDKEYRIDIISYALDKLYEKNELVMIIDVFQNITLNITKQIEYKDKIKELIVASKCNLNEDIINFMIQEGLDDMKTIIMINSKIINDMFIKDWYKQCKLGKITEIIKKMIDNDIREINDVAKIENLIEQYGLNDIKLELLLKLKVYNLIERRLWDLSNKDSELDKKIVEILEQIIKFNLEERLLSDKFLLSQLDEGIEKKIQKSLLETTNSERVIEIYWNIVENLIDERNTKEIIRQLEILLPFITVSTKRRDWLLEKIENRKYDFSIMIILLEVTMEFMSKYRISINQYETEKRLNNKERLEGIAQVICNSITDIEKGIIRINDEVKDKNILINAIKSLRKDLRNIGIDTVESIELYGKEIQVDIDKHYCTMNTTDFEIGKIESLGVKVKDLIIELSQVRCVEKGGDINE